MSLTKMSFLQAREISNLANNLLIYRGGKTYFARSELKGYDEIDIDNAYKIELALKYFFDSNFAASKEFAELSSAALISLCDDIISDDKYFELNNYTDGTPEYWDKLLEVKEKHFWDKFSELETPQSFLLFLKNLGREDIVHYWEEVYNRLGLKCSLIEIGEYLVEFSEKQKKSKISSVTKTAKGWKLFLGWLRPNRN